jgi:hypothetical protein
MRSAPLVLAATAAASSAWAACRDDPLIVETELGCVAGIRLEGLPTINPRCDAACRQGTQRDPRLPASWWPHRGF